MIPSENTVACYHGNTRCPSAVTPQFLEEARGQGVCADERDKYYCNVACTPDGQVNWLSSVCPNDLVSPCPPWQRSVVPGYVPGAAPAPPTTLHGPDVAPVPSPDAGPAAPGLRGDRFAGPALLALVNPTDADIVRRTGGFNLRGAQVRRASRGVGGGTMRRCSGWGRGGRGGCSAMRSGCVAGRDAASGPKLSLSSAPRTPRGGFENGAPWLTPPQVPDCCRAFPHSHHPPPPHPHVSAKSTTTRKRASRRTPRAASCAPPT
jgi:hypothetical protein